MVRDITYTRSLILDVDKVAIRIKNTRKSLGITQIEFAERIGATVSAVSNWELGRNLPNNKLIKMIASVGKVSIEELLYGQSVHEKNWHELKDKINKQMNLYNDIKHRESYEQLEFVLNAMRMIENNDKLPG